ncbi:hypothetical protein [Oceaniradius stylonematis]|uniref:hypothetical protein n=1 Tax=Oceaniradius stylonematis TaxID=2184161 RepID=UPI00273E5103|nr:hypothetical protein [Oceaniradius stylonematis]
MADPRKALLNAAAGIDVIELAGMIIANPDRRAMATSAAGVLALAHATERFWEIALEGEVLARAVSQLPDDDLKTHAIETQAQRVRDLMDALRAPNPATERS